MSGKQDKSTVDKLKNMFKKNKGTGSLCRSKEFHLSEEMQRDLKENSPVHIRLKALRDLKGDVMDCQIEMNDIGRLCSYTLDLLSNANVEVRHSTFTFLQTLVKYQNERLGLIRTKIFQIVKEYNDDVLQRFELLQALTENGREILYMENDVAPFLLNWFPEISKAGIVEMYMLLLDNMIKFNAAYVEEEVVNGLVQHIWFLCCNAQEQDVKACLQLLENIVAYSTLPPDSLPQYIGTLCRTVNVESYCQLSWNIMRKLLGTHMGHSSLTTLCGILREPCLSQDIFLIRGAVFYVGMALWGRQHVVTLQCSPGSVLPHIYQAVQGMNPIISYEVMICINLLINKHGTELHGAPWDVILNILLTIIKQIDSNPKHISNSQTLKNLHDTLTIIENFIDNGIFNGSIKKFFEIIDECAARRPEASVVRLVTYLSRSIIPTEVLWLTNLYNLLQRYFNFKQEGRPNIRLKVLDVLSNVIQLHWDKYEDELIDRIVIPHLVGIVNDPDVTVRASSSKLLLELCANCETKRCSEMLDILEKLLYRPYEVYSENTILTDTDLFDIKALVEGLIRVFVIKVYKLPSTHAIKIYQMLIKFLEFHYGKPKLFENCNQIRYKIFDCFLKMRADTTYHLGCINSNGEIKFSRYLCVTYTLEKSAMMSPPPPSPAITPQPQCVVTYVSVKCAFKLFITCLRSEKDWDILNLLLLQLPNVLQNKSLILSKQGNPDMHLLVETLSQMIVDKTLAETFRSNRSDFIAAVLSVLANLASYHNYLNQAAQQEMIGCLYKYLSFKCARQCITALMTCTLEMRDTSIMVKMLPQVLLSLSKISATDRIAIPVLEFLSTLTVLPMVFANFVADEYMAVFAISLPYTNPFKYNHYIVSLAHHVIAVWFLKCRLPFRKEFVRFITSGLQTNALTPFEETNFLKQSDVNKLNQDSSDRKRSSSLTEQGSRRPNRSSMSISRPTVDVKCLTSDFKVNPDKLKMAFYEELTETCIDLMARYAFSPCSALPRRLPTADFLLSGGQSTSWLLGNKVITITTSGCAQKALKHGLCDKCFTACRIDRTTPEDTKKTSRNNSTEKEKEDSSARVTRQNSADKSNTNTSTSSPVDDLKKLGDKLEQLPSKLQQLSGGHRDSSSSEKLRCACWCQGWAEIYVRRPTGDMSWVMRIQNQIADQQSIYEFPINEISTLFTSSLNQNSSDVGSFDKDFQHQGTSTSQDEEVSAATAPISIPGSPNKNSPSRQSSRDSIDEDVECIYEDGSRSRNPVQRSNSSPEMSANWRNPFIQQKQQEREERNQIEDENKKLKKDLRVSCEAIPEEIAGTTPPTDTIHSQHPSLLNSLSYPGSSVPGENHPVKPSQTVPVSPNPSSQAIAARCQYTRNYGMLRSAKSDSIDSINSEKSTQRPNTLPTFSSTALAAKPPQSPTQTSPRPQRSAREGNEIQKSASEKTGLQYLKKEKRDVDKLTASEQSLSSQIRDRGYTISVMSPVRKPNSELLRHAHSSGRPKEAPKSGISPSFIFLQLYHAAHLKNSTEKPLLIDSSDIVQRALTVLDYIPPYETHKIGVLYVGPGQSKSEADILRNKVGSVRYQEFLQNLGTLIKIIDADPQVVFLGGLEQGGCDGEFSYIWQDDVIRVMFHVATMMPNKESDPNCHDKKRHIGNDNVTIVYNESGEEYNINTIKGQFNFASIIIQPLDHNTNRVTVKVKEDLLRLIGMTEPKLVSDHNVAILARQLALHANMASLVFNSLKNSGTNPYASNWLERLRKIKNLKNKIQEVKKEPDEVKMKRVQMEDFTKYT